MPLTYEGRPLTSYTKKELMSIVSQQMFINHRLQSEKVILESSVRNLKTIYQPVLDDYKWLRQPLYRRILLRLLGMKP